MSLAELAENFGTDKHWGHNYMPAYEAVFPPRDGEVRLLEIGVLHGDSLRLWDAWFTNEETTIIGLDTSTHVAHLELPSRVITHVIDAKEFRPADDERFDVVIDDGSHHTDDIITCLRNLWPYVREGGIYVIEDLQTQETPRVNRCLEYLSEFTRPLITGQRGYDLAEVHIYNELWIGRKRVSV